MIPRAPVGAALRAARLRAGLSIEQLAVYAGVGAATVARIEHEQVSPNTATLLALARVLENSNAAVDGGGVATTAGAGGGRAER